MKRFTIAEQMAAGNCCTFEPHRHAIRDAHAKSHAMLKGEDGPLAAGTARRLACDASLVRIVEDESGQPLERGSSMTAPCASPARGAGRSRGNLNGDEGSATR